MREKIPLTCGLKRKGQAFIGVESIKEYRPSPGNAVKSITPTKISEPCLTHVQVRTFGIAERASFSVISEIYAPLL